MSAFACPFASAPASTPVLFFPYFHPGFVPPSGSAHPSAMPVRFFDDELCCCGLGCCPWGNKASGNFSRRVMVNENAPGERSRGVVNDDVEKESVPKNRGRLKACTISLKRAFRI